MQSNGESNITMDDRNHIAPDSLVGKCIGGHDQSVIVTIIVVFFMGNCFMGILSQKPSQKDRLGYVGVSYH